jgi:hypothetical protein
VILLKSLYTGIATQGAAFSLIASILMDNEMKGQGLGWEEGRSSDVRAFMLLAVLLSCYGGGTPLACEAGVSADLSK